MPARAGSLPTPLSRLAIEAGLGLFDNLSAGRELTLQAASTAQDLPFSAASMGMTNNHSSGTKGFISLGPDAKVMARLGPTATPATTNATQSGFTDLAESHYTYDGIMRAYERARRRLRVNHIDVLLLSGLGVTDQGELQDSLSFPVAMSGGYRALDELRSSGAVQAIGIASNDIDLCNKALAFGDWDVFVLEHRFTLLEQWPLTSLLPRCEDSSTSVIVSEPFNSGILSPGLADAANDWNYRPAPDFVLARVQNIVNICQLHDVPLGAAALQFPLLHPCVASVLPEICSTDDLHTIMKWWNHAIPAQFWSDLKLAGLLLDEA